jgi:hypothetical protein
VTQILNPQPRLAQMSDDTHNIEDPFHVNVCFYKSAKNLTSQEKSIHGIAPHDLPTKPRGF